MVLKKTKENSFWWFVLPVIAFIFLFVSFLVASSSIGASDEELTDFTSAVAMNNGESVSPSVRIMGRYIPFVNSPYMGAMRTWIIAPVISSFGTSMYVVRFLNIISAMIYLMCLYWALRVIVGKSLALLVFLIPVFDSKFLLYAPFDYGPFLYQLIFISLSLGGMFRFFINKDIKWWFFANFMIGSILAQKITSLPVFVALFLINNLYYLKLNIKNIFSVRVLQDIVGSVFLFMLSLAPNIFYFYKYGFSDFIGITADPEKINFVTYWPKLKEIFKIFLASFDGVFWARGSTLVKEINPILPVFGYTSFLTILITLIYSFKKKLKKSYLWLAFSVFLLSLLLFTLVRGLTRSHHYFVLQPIWMSLFIIACSYIYRSLDLKRAKLILLLSVVIPIFFMTINSSFLLIQIYRYKGAALSSMAIDNVVKSMSALSAKKVYGLNFSISSQIYFLSNGVIKGENLTWTPLNKDQLSVYIDKVKNDPGSYLVARRATNYDWSKDWMEYLNRDVELNDLITYPEKYGVKTTVFSDNRGTSFYIIK